MTDRLVAACEWKSADDAGSGELTGYMSVFDVLDQGGDVCVKGCFKKSFSDWSRAKAKMPLISDHEISTSGVIGSVVHLAEDDYGARIRARFSSIAKAQNVRQLMVEGNLSGMSFTYSPVRFPHGTFRGEPARFLDEVRVFEASVVVLPMNELALASAKAGPGVADHADLDAQFAELEAWSRRVAMSSMIEHPASTRYALNVLEATRLQQQQRQLEAWVAAQPPPPSDAERAAARRRADWERRNDDSNALAAVMERIERTACGHRGCPPGRCHYRR
jgi:HK97 family phage prohead protease